MKDKENQQVIKTKNTEILLVNQCAKHKFRNMKTNHATWEQRIPNEI